MARTHLGETVGPAPHQRGKAGVTIKRVVVFSLVEGPDFDPRKAHTSAKCSEARPHSKVRCA